MAQRWVTGLGMVMVGAAAIVAGSLGHWVHGVSIRESEVVNSTERHWMVAAGVALILVVVVVGVTFARASVRLGWLQFVAWFHAALVVVVSTLDTRAKVGSSKPDLGDRVGWGLWLSCAGVAIAAVGMVLANRVDSSVAD